MRLFPVVLLSAFLSIGAFAQQSNININRNESGPAKPSGEKKPAPVATPAERKRALQLLESSEPAVRGMDAGTQAMALTQMAQAYSTSNKKKAIAMLKDAMRQSQDVDFSSQPDAEQLRLRARIQQKILAQLLELAPESVESMVSDVDADTKKVILQALLDHYVEAKEDDKAVDALEQLTQLQEMPYASASDLMSRMTNDDSLELRRLFTDALNSYDQRDDPKQMRFGASFSDLIVKFHAQLPPELVRQAIDTVLTHAKDADEQGAKAGNSAPSITLASAKGSAQFNSRYDLALSTLYPTLVELDPSYAERLLKEHRDAQLFLAKYPAGVPGLSSKDDGGGGGKMSVMMNNGAPPKQQQGGGSQGRGAPMGMNSTDMQLFNRIENDATAHPQDAMANVPLIGSFELQGAAYVGIAQSTLKKDPALAKSALRKAMELIPKIRTEQQVNEANQIASIYQRLGDNENSKAAVEKAFGFASDIYKSDANADDPNTAPKWFWPSTAAWRSSMVVATRLDPAWANGLLKDIPDDDIRALNQLAIAMESAKIPMRLVEVMEFHKDGNNKMMISRTDGDDQ